MALIKSRDIFSDSEKRSLTEAATWWHRLLELLFPRPIFHAFFHCNFKEAEREILTDDPRKEKPVTTVNSYISP
jgi:hypothetical protein